MYVNEVLLTGSEKYHLGVMNGPLKFLSARKILTFARFAHKI